MLSEGSVENGHLNGVKYALLPELGIHFPIGDLGVSIVSAGALCLFVGVFWVLRSRGLRAQVSACVLIVALSVTQLLVRKVTTPPYDFAYPACVTATHFL